MRQRLQLSRCVKLASLAIITVTLQLLFKNSLFQGVNSGAENRSAGMLSGVSKSAHSNNEQSYSWSLGGVSLRPGIWSVQNSPFILLGKKEGTRHLTKVRFLVSQIEFSMWTVACAGKVKEKSSNWEEDAWCWWHSICHLEELMREHWSSWHIKKCWRLLDVKY